MKIKTNQTRKDLIRNILLGFFWSYGSMAGKFVHTRTNICLTIIRISFIVLGVVGVNEYYLQNKA